MNGKNTAALCAGLLAAQILFAAEPASTPVTSTKPGPESDLVTASRKSKATPRRKAKLSITDKDVKQSKGKLIIIAATDEPTAAGPVPAGIRDPRAMEKATVELDRAMRDVAALEAELLRHESDYYKEDNASFRDEIIVQRFNATRRKLDQARQDLAAAREARARLEPVTIK